MFLSVRRCAEPMTQLCRLKVKVILQGQSWDSMVRDLAVLQTAVLLPLIHSFEPLNFVTADLLVTLIYVLALEGIY